MSVELALQKVLNGLFRGDASLEEHIEDRVYDRVPRSPNFPYVELGQATSSNEDTGCTARREIFLDVHIWSRAVGKVEAWRIIGDLREAVRTADRSEDPITADGCTIRHVRASSSRVFTDPDGLTTHGVVTIEALVDPSS